MAEHKGRIKAVQLGVGAAFSFITGKVKEAPRWMQQTGLEWLFRLPQQPGKTLYRMSLVPEFILRTIIQIVKR
jgi:N-acetylglucosaminyldiphosphoundecaprenol N-acetyl-beta-D-mannosaminyltransferase